MKQVLLTILWLLLPISIFAQTAKITYNQPSSIYKKGEKIIVKVNSQNLKDSLQIRITSNTNKVILNQCFAPNCEVTVLESSYKEPCNIVVTASEKGNRRTLASVGCLVSPKDFKPGYKRPKDIDQYWNDQKAQLASIALNPKMKELEIQGKEADNFVCYDVELNCLGPKPARGYFAKPKQAEPKSLPIVILVRAAGVSGDWCKCQVGEVVDNANHGKGALSFDLNAHGMLNGQPDQYYIDLERNELANYYHQGIDNRDDYYFRGMYLRLLQTIEFLTQQPEWDGKRILVIGESQGGGQAVAAAALDHRVSAVVLNVPAMQDFGGALTNRLSGWPQPIEYVKDNQKAINEVLPYFDGAMLVKGCKATVVAEIGLIDTTCPPPGIYATLNQIKGEKIIRTVPYRGHSWPSGTIRPSWEKEYLQKRLDFIDSYLQ